MITRALILLIGTTTPLFATSSLGGAAGRPDSLKRPALKESTPAAVPSPTPTSVPRRQFEWLPQKEVDEAALVETTLSSKSKTPILVAASPYDAVLSDRQKEILQDRAEAKNLTTYSYDEVLDAEEKVTLAKLLHSGSRTGN